jgi:hypothetical protein
MDVQELSVRAAQIKNTVRTLTSERAKLAPQAINGSLQGPAARERIAAIDVERAATMLELETVTAALASPEYKHAFITQRLEDSFRRKFKELKFALGHNLRHDYANKARFLDQLISENRLEQAKGIAEEVPALPHVLASDLTRETITRQELEGVKLGTAMHANDPRFDNGPTTERLEVSLAIFSRHTQQLLQETKLPAVPPELQAQVDRLTRVLANRSGNSAGQENLPIGAKVIRGR